MDNSKIFNIMNKKYIVIMNFTAGTIAVHNACGKSEKHFGVKSSECVWGYYDELPDFDESLTLDCGDSYRYLTIFDFTQNKGIVIPLTKDMTQIINDDFIDNYCVRIGLYPGSDWMITEDDEIYFTTIND